MKRCSMIRKSVKKNNLNRYCRHFFISRDMNLQFEMFYDPLNPPEGVEIVQNGV